MGCGMSMVKYLLFLFNLLCALCGIVFIVLGSLFLSHVSSFKEFVDELGAQQIPIGLIVLGSLIFIIAFFGCCGAIRESYCMSMTYAVSLFVLIVLDIALIVYIFIARSNQNDILTKAVEKLWKTGTEPGSAFRGLEAALKCCGKDGPQSYSIWNLANLPASCCPMENNQPSSLCTAFNAYKQGCEPALKDFVAKNINILGYVGIGIVVVELVGFIFACCLANHIRNHKRRSAY